MAAAKLDTHLDGKPMPASWRRRPEIDGLGPPAFAAAQQPNCRPVVPLHPRHRRS